MKLLISDLLPPTNTAWCFRSSCNPLNFENNDLRLLFVFW